MQRIARKQPLSAPNDVTRYFVSPDESGEICMLACMLGKSGEIYFPKLGKEQVKTFSSIATDLLTAMGYRAIECGSEQEAIDMAAQLQEDDKRYPVYYSGSNTTGEKPYEEFFTDDETTDMTRHEALGVVTGVQPRPMGEIDTLFTRLTEAFARPSVTKAEIVEIMKEFLHNFEHEEKGLNLDSKM